MKSRTAIVVTIILILLTWGSSALLAARMPSEMASHWNMSGQADGYTSRLSGLWFMPVLQLVLVGLLYFLPRLDPLKHNLASFETIYQIFVAGMTGFFMYVHQLTLAWNLGWKFDMSQMMMPGFALLFFLAGVLIKNARQNYFIGIRTPWTLASPLVWAETHRVGGIGFQVAAVLSLAGIFFPRLSMYFILVPVLLVALGSTIYSYIVFQKHVPHS